MIDHDLMEMGKVVQGATNCCDGAGSATFDSGLQQLEELVGFSDFHEVDVFINACEAEVTHGGAERLPVD